MMVPYIVFFSTASAALLATVFVKGTLLAHKWRSHRYTGPGRQRQLSNVAGMQIGSRLQEGMASSSQHLEKAHTLTTMFLDNKMERWQQYCALLTAVFEDIPMGTGSRHVCIAPARKDGAVGLVCVRHHEYVLPFQDDGGMRRRSGRSRREQADLRPQLVRDPCPLAEYAAASCLVSHFGHDWWALCDLMRVRHPHISRHAGGQARASDVNQSEGGRGEAAGERTRSPFCRP